MTHYINKKYAVRKAVLKLIQTREIALQMVRSMGKYHRLSEKQYYRDYYMAQIRKYNKRADAAMYGIDRLLFKHIK